jgi:ATP-dependent DNA helicase RecG
MTAAQQAAQQLWQHHQRAAEALIRRWLGFKDIYAQA